jgi:hypothetical protein
VDVNRDQRQRRPRLERLQQLARRVQRHAELVDLQPRRNMGMALGIDIRVDAHRDAHRSPEPRPDRLEARQLAGRFDVDRLDPERHRRLELLRCLADAGEDDLRRREPALRATSISHTELASTELPSSRSSRAIASVEFALSA